MTSSLFVLDTRPGYTKTPPILLIHGDMSTGTGTWSRQLEAEGTGDGEKNRFIVVDRKGHGRSSAGPKPYTIRQDAKDIIGWLDRRDINSVHVAGHSYGGLIAIEIATMIPHRLRTLHLIEPSYLALLPDDPIVQKLDRDVRSLLQTASTLTDEHITESFFTILMGRSAVEKIKQRTAWPGLVAEARRLTEQQFAGDFSPRKYDEFIEKRRDVGDYPVIVYTGGQSHPALQLVAEEIARRCPGAHIVKIDEAGHAVQRIGDPFENVFRSHLV